MLEQHTKPSQCLFFKRVTLRFYRWQVSHSWAWASQFYKGSETIETNNECTLSHPTEPLSVYTYAIQTPDCATPWVKTKWEWRLQCITFKLETIRMVMSKIVELFNKRFISRAVWASLSPPVVMWCGCGIVRWRMTMKWLVRTSSHEDD